MIDGREGPDTLLGRDGWDDLTGGPGADILVGGLDDDFLRGLDGTADQISCGDGADVTQADPQDVLVDCEPSPRGDFNGDGFADLAVGVPGEDVDAAEPGDAFGTAVATGDVNGDGLADLLVGAPGEDVGTTPDAGMVHVLLGSPSGLTTAGQQTWTQDSQGISDTMEAGDRFGAVLATGRISGADMPADLVVGTPSEDVGTVADAGLIELIPGGPSGLTATGEQAWSQNSRDVLGSAESGDAFGSALAVGDFDGAAGEDVAIGAPGESIGSVSRAGAVQVLPSGASGLQTTGQQLWSQASTGVGDAPETGDGFGAALAAGPIDSSDGFAELAIGVPSEDVATTDPQNRPVIASDAGLVQTLRGSSSGLRAAQAQTLTQHGPEVLEVAAPNNRFGAALAIGSLDDDPGEDLAVGGPGEYDGRGAVHFLPGRPSGVATSTNNSRSGEQIWWERSPDVAGNPEVGDDFGLALSIRRIDYGRFEDLVIGVPGASAGAATRGGRIHVLPGAAHGLTADRSIALSQNSGDVADTVEQGDAFGSSLGFGG